MLTVTMDARNVIAAFDRGGIPEDVRRNLRAVLPDITRKVAAAVNRNLDSRLKSRRRLQVVSELVENPRGLFGRVTVVATSPPVLLPVWLESGTAPHIIEARNAGALSFFWDKVGKQMFLQRVNHPGFPAYNFMRDAFAEMEPEIKLWITESVKFEIERQASLQRRFSR